MDMPASPTNTIWYSGHVLPERKEQLADLERLGALLKAANYRLLIQNLCRQSLPDSCPATPLPPPDELIESFANANRATQLDYSILQAAAVFSAKSQCDFPHALAYMKSYCAFLEAQLELETPCFCIMSVQFKPWHIVLRSLCEAHGIRFAYLGGGVLPGTMVLEPGGQMGVSLVAQESEKFKQLPVDKNDLEAAVQYLDHARRERLSRKPQASERLATLLVTELRKSNEQIVFCAGQNDIESGIWPHWLPEARLHSPFFSNTLEALDYLSLLANKNNWHVLFKPHPMMEQQHATPIVTCPERITCLPGANIFECMEQSDATTTILSQAGYLALIHDRPLVMLGRNQLSGKDCAYEIDSVEATEAAFKRAFLKDAAATMRENWLRHVAQVLKYYLIAHDPKVANISGRGIETLSKLIIGQVTVASFEEQIECAWTRQT